MSKTGDTKNKILEMLSQKRMTLTEISQKLNLAPSTVNQHIKELLSANAIKQVDNPFVIKWKYYEVNPQFKGASVQEIKAIRAQNQIPLSNPIFKAVSVIVVLGIAALLLLYLTSNHAPTTTTALTTISAVPVSATLFSISDSPTVSSVSAVNVTVDSAQIYSKTTGKWYTISSTPKTFNLVKLRNISAALGTANLSAGTYSQILLEVSNITAVVNNQTVSVLLPSHSLSIVGNFNISGNSGTSWVDVDVNLDKSLHFATNGELVMLPVIKVRSSGGTSLSVTSNGIVLVRNPGTIRAQSSTNMSVNGSFANAPAPPLNAQLAVEDGKLAVLTTRVGNTLVVRTPNKVIVITNVTNVSNVIANISVQSATGGVVSVANNGALPRAKLNCTMADGYADCQTVTNIVIAPLPIPCINCTRYPYNSSYNTTIYNTSNPSNLPSALVNASDTYCQTASNCTIVQKTYCANGLPWQSACINNGYLQQYYSWYDQNISAQTSTHIQVNETGVVGIGTATNGAVAQAAGTPAIVCPMYIVYTPRFCGCVSNVCTLEVGKIGPGVTSTSTSS